MQKGFRYSVVCFFTKSGTTKSGSLLKFFLASLVHHIGSRLRYVTYFWMSKHFVITIMVPRGSIVVFGDPLTFHLVPLGGHCSQLFSEISQHLEMD